MREPVAAKAATPQNQDTPKQESVTTAAIPPAPACAGARIDRSDQAEPREDTHREGERIADRIARADVAAVADAGDLANACRARRAQRAGIAAAASRREARRARRAVDASRRCAPPAVAPARRARRRAVAAPKPQPVYASASAPAAISAAAPVPAAQPRRPGRARHFIRKQAAQRLDRPGRRLRRHRRSARETDRRQSARPRTCCAAAIRSPSRWSKATRRFTARALRD